MKKVDLIKLSITDEGELLTGVHEQLEDDLGDEQLRKILGHMNKVAKIIAEAVTELEEENENE